RPYIILKCEQTRNGIIANTLQTPLAGEGPDKDSVIPRLLISNEYTNRLVHKWRSEEAGVMIGTNTALADNPELTTRLWTGPSPVRMIIDMDLRLPATLKIFNHEVLTIIFNRFKQEEKDNLLYYQVREDSGIVHQVVTALYQLKIQSVMIEGGAKLLQSFIDEQIWDEIRVIKNNELIIEKGLSAPQLKKAVPSGSFNVSGDLITIFKPASL
ncbi:MAG: diaminohydroxyphosphoribosylaminopyrimidine deaminase, partial [Chitinophagaceae bacterium]|nr:diaminohydroxyphosphoribosylaminopyrimidine deaminase [Chitinophagaceae bacterium]